MGSVSNYTHFIDSKAYSYEGPNGFVSLFRSIEMLRVTGACSRSPRTPQWLVVPSTAPARNQVLICFHTGLVTLLTTFRRDSYPEIQGCQKCREVVGMGRQQKVHPRKLGLGGNDAESFYHHVRTAEAAHAHTGLRVQEQQQLF